MTTEVWRRIVAEISTRPHGAGREASWLAERLEMKIQRVNNWKTRGVPPEVYQDIASILGWTIDEVAGKQPVLRDSHWPFDPRLQADFESLTEREKGEVETRVRDALTEIRARKGKRSGT